MSSPASLFIGLLLLASAIGSSGQEGHRAGGVGLTFDHPGKPWKKVASAPAAGGGTEYRYEDPNDEARGMRLIVWELERIPALEGLCDSELDQMEDQGEVRELDRYEREVAGRAALGVRYRFESEEGTELVLDATYFRTSAFLGRIAVSVPVSERRSLDDLVAESIAALRFVEPGRDPVTVHEPVAGNVLTVVHGAGEEVWLDYLEALPGAALHGTGEPLVLVVEDELSEPARDFLRKFRPEDIRLVGEEHPELPQARAAQERWAAGGTVVVASGRMVDAVQAACLAARLKVPLLIDRGALEERLAALEPRRVLVVGSVLLASERFALEKLASPVEIARAAGGADYLAVCNVAEGANQGTAALAAALAAARDGIVLPIEEPVVRHEIPLRRTRDCPPGLEDEQSTGNYLVARFEAAGKEIVAAAPQTTVVNVAGHDSPRYGRLRIDLDANGVLEDDEEPRIGDTIRLGGSDYHLTYHYAHAFVGYLGSELILDELDPKRVRARIQDVASELGTLRYVAIVGTPDHIPFHYEEAAGYFDAYDIKQELPSDAPYANLDDDRYLELAVGRLPFDTLSDGSAALATTLAYPYLPDEAWTQTATMIQPGFHELEGALPWVLPNAEALIRSIEGDLAHGGVESLGFYRDQVGIKDVLSAMSRSGWIAYFNHSGPGTWGIHPGASIVASGSRGGYSLPALEGAPIVFGGGCSSAALDVGQPLSATFPGRFFELGAVAYLGNTRVAYARSEHLVQLFFARLGTEGATLGEAYRDGRNYLGHLLDAGHLSESLDKLVLIGEREFLEGQYSILNLFGDPALRPRLPADVTLPIDVRLEEGEGAGHMTLAIENRGAERVDSVLMMPASGQGKPREFQVHNGAGMTSSHLPYQYVRKGLSPVRSIPEVQPGAWVDVALPRGAQDVRVELADGPAFSDRGFAIARGAAGEPRLLMYVPLVRANFETSGEVEREVRFDVRFTPSDSAEVERKLAARLRPQATWQAERKGAPKTTRKAAKALAGVRERHAPFGEWFRSRAPRWSMKSPAPKFYGETTRFHVAWSETGEPMVEVRGLPEQLSARRAEIESSVTALTKLLFTTPLPPLEGMSVSAKSAKKIVLTPMDEAEGEERTEVRLNADGTVRSIATHQFDTTAELVFEWQATAAGPILKRCTARDPVRPEESLVYDVDYDADPSDADGFSLPRRITLRIEGILPKPAYLDIVYEDES